MCVSELCMCLYLRSCVEICAYFMHRRMHIRMRLSGSLLRIHANTWKRSPTVFKTVPMLLLPILYALNDNWGYTQADLCAMWVGCCAIGFRFDKHFLQRQKWKKANNQRLLEQQRNKQTNIRWKRESMESEKEAIECQLSVRQNAWHKLTFIFSIQYSLIWPYLSWRVLNSSGDAKTVVA